MDCTVSAELHGCMIKLGSNISSLMAQRRLAEGSEALGKSFERLSSGLRINRASDDAAGLAISSTLRSSSRVFTRAILNSQDAVSMLNIADGALSSLSSVVIRLKELAEQAANGVYSSSQRNAINTEAQALRNEYNRIVSSVEFNEINLFDPATQTTQLQVGVDGTTNSILSFDLGSALERNIGDGTFQSAVQINNLPMSAQAIGDFDGDGDMDIAVNHFAGAGNFYIYLSNNDGSFKAGVSYAGASFYDLKTADLNGDGVLDLVGNNGSGTTSVALGNGDGTFKARTAYSVVADNLGSDIADLNSDGVLDIIVKDGSANTMSVLMGRGDGTFNSAVTYTATGVSGVAAGDFNGDGKIDVISGPGTGDSYLTLGNGDGTFKASTLISGVNTFQDTAALDLNGDGNLDLVSASNGIRVHLGNGNGTFKVGLFQAGVANFFFSLGDLNDDGFIDIGVSDTLNDNFRALLGNGDGTFKAPTTSVSMGVHVVNTISGDFSGDDVPDAIASTNVTNSGLYLLIQNSYKSVTLKSFTLATQSSARTAMMQFDTALNRISNERSGIGAILSRLEIATSNLQAMRENYEAAYSRIMDVDVTEETANMTRLKILQQSASAILVQANQEPALAIKLLKAP